MDSDERLWHITVVVGGPARPQADVSEALSRLATLRPFMHSLRHDADRAEVRFWEEAPTALDAASLAMRVWGEFRGAIGLADWEMTGFEIARRSQHLRRDDGWQHEVEVGISPFG
ncbi:hypothetical protein KLP28_03765 [Nocardioidaceae bacterium]|nr:hypothetical protein KLP28_03765 [Nocardioidaceae bacterium]